MKYTHTNTTRLAIIASLCTIVIIAFIYSIAIRGTHAYYTTDQKALLLNDTTGLFLIEYSFGVKNRSITMPVQAKDTIESSQDQVSYSIVDKDGKRVTGETKSIVISTAHITKDTMYLLPKGMKTKSTLVVLFTPEKGIPKQEYHLQVNHLPFTFDDATHLQLNPSELQYYKTKPISL